MMENIQVYNFVEWELQKFRDECNFTDEELQCFELKAKDKSIEYTHYINIKRDYQLGRATDESLIYAMEKVCKEIEEFIETLYFNTEFLKERLKIKSMIENLQKIGE